MRTHIGDQAPFRLELVQLDDGEYPIRFESVCLQCHAVVAATTYDRTIEDDPDAEARIESDAMENALVANQHRCAEASARRLEA